MGNALCGFLLLFLVGITAEWFWYRYALPGLNTDIILTGLFLRNIVFACKLLFGLGIIYLIINCIKESWAKTMAWVVLGFVVIMQYILFLYFSETQNTLGADFLYYSKDEIEQILKASGMLNVKNFALLGILLGATVIPLWMAGKSAFKSMYIGIALLCIGFAAFFIPDHILQSDALNKANTFSQTAAKSKWAYFLCLMKIILSVTILKLQNY
ncbi:hypothetical protein [Chryseobacterium sp. CH1]|uniref:hypothetical protein n=1 Tax=Chryseobacterium sp. CH1 TaxID=713551 RepID=UPI00100C29B0|nr:hypothetical protein [Chryseobacterium sp. CH1]RXM64582.1 hypothetical protein BOQ60_10170 [Chryseobacterium sp. CH1]